jgi:hypothetical protein
MSSSSIRGCLRLDPTNMDSMLETLDITSICARGLGEREGE